MNIFIRGIAPEDSNNIVLVVRCKDCKHYNAEERACDSGGTWLPDDFCSYGERREE